MLDEVLTGTAVGLHLSKARTAGINPVGWLRAGHGVGTPAAATSSGQIRRP
jgi:hypothetical protein